MTKRSSRAKAKRNVRRAEPESLTMNIDIRTNRGEKIYSTRDKKVEEILGPVLKILRINYGIEPEKLEKDKDEF